MRGGRFCLVRMGRGCYYIGRMESGDKQMPSLAYSSRKNLGDILLFYLLCLSLCAIIYLIFMDCGLYFFFYVVMVLGVIYMIALPCAFVIWSFLPSRMHRVACTILSTAPPAVVLSFLSCSFSVSFLLVFFFASYLLPLALYLLIWLFRRYRQMRKITPSI